MKIILKITLWLAGLLTIMIVIFVAAMWAVEWVPDEIEYQSTGGIEPDVLRCGDTLKIVSWNIGYAGLGDDMDFFYDGGNQVRCSEERTRRNLNEIIEFLKQHRDADFILLQEVDFDSKRSYGMDQYDSIRTALPEFMGWWGLNYVSRFVPIPVTEPIGRVRAGIVTMSRHAPVEVVRFQYPCRFGFPTRLFNLKRCMLSVGFRVDGSDGLFYLSNTHNTAYDTGGMRSAEMSFVRKFMEEKEFSLTAGDWNSNPPQYKASDRELNDPNFSPYSIQHGEFPEEWVFMADTTVLSTRYGNEPYDRRTTICTLLDFALVGGGVEPLSVETVDLNFKNSDHNPVIFRMVLRNVSDQ